MTDRISYSRRLLTYRKVSKMLFCGLVSPLLIVDVSISASPHISLTSRLTLGSPPIQIRPW